MGEPRGSLVTRFAVMDCRFRSNLVALEAELNGSDLRGWAVKGAEQRLLEIAAEAEAVYGAFPELRARGRPGGNGGVRGVTGAGGVRRRRRRRMSAEARAKISAAQKARWAKQKRGGRL